MGLRVQLSLWVGLLIAVIIAGLAYTVYRHERAVLQEGLEARGTSLTQMFARFLVDPVLKQDLTQMQNLIEEGRQNHLYDYAYVIDTEGNFLAHTVPGLVGNRLADSPYIYRLGIPRSLLRDSLSKDRAVLGFIEEARRADRERRVLRQRILVNWRRWMDFSTAVSLAHDQDLGAFLRVGFDERDQVDKVVQATQERLAWLFVPALLMGILICTFLAGHIVRPIRLVVDNVRHIASGEYGQFIDVDSPRELSVLADSVNQMSSEIRERINEIGEANSKLDRRVYELQVLYEVSKQMNFKSYSPELLSYLLDTTQDALNACWGSIMLLDEETDNLQTQIVRGASWDSEKATQIPVGEGIAGYVFARGEPVISNLGSLDPRFSSLPGQNREFERQIRQLICVPLLADDRPIGVINVINKRDGSEFDENDLRLFTALASQAARSLENARLYGETIRESKTGLYIPSYFQARVNDEITNARRFEEEFSIVMADVDFFKKVNDVHGHLIGDEVLIRVARFIKETIRESIDVACRFGGDVFSILLPRTDREGALSFSERLRSRTENKSEDTDKGLPQVTMSLGTATYPGSGNSYESLVEAADKHLYTSKKNGRNQVTG